MNLAIISPNQNAYSETFIQNHKKYFDANVKFYYGGHLPVYLEGEARLRLSRKERLGRYIKKYVLRQELEFTDEEKALYNSFRKQNINVVYAEYGQTGAAVTRVCKALGIPLIVNFHGYDASMYSVLKEYKERYEEMFMYASKTVAVSKAMYNRLLSIGCPKEKLEYITYGPGNVFFDVRPAYSEKSFIFMGRFVDKKAPYYTILAMKKVVEKHPDAKLYMAGEGPLMDACVNLSEFFDLKSNIIFLGRCSHDEIISYYEKVTAYVQHSITPANGDMEGTPVAILEASAAGLPVISTKHAGIPDVILNGKTGLLVEEHDVDGMAEAMIQLLDDKEKASQLGLAGRTNIAENFSMEIHIAKLNNMIHSLSNN